MGFILSSLISLVYRYRTEMFNGINPGNLSVY